MRDVYEDTDILDFMQGDLEVLKDDRIEAIKAVDQHYFSVKKVAAYAGMIVVDDDPSCERALDIAGDAKNLAKRIEEDRKKAIEPHRKIVGVVNDAAKKFQLALDQVEAMIKVKLSQYQFLKQVEAETAQKAVKELSESLGLDVEILAPNAPSTLSSEKASTSTREKYTFEITDATLVPDEFWVIDEKLIQKHIALGKREIPGVEIKTEKTMIIRRK